MFAHKPWTDIVKRVSLLVCRILLIAVILFSALTLSCAGYLAHPPGFMR